MAAVKLLPLASLAGTATSWRSLRSPVVAVVEAAQVPSASTLTVPDAVRVRRVIHPMFVAWLTDAGWVAVGGNDGDGDPAGVVGVSALTCRPSPRTADDGPLAPVRAVVGDQAASQLLVGVRRSVFPVGAFTLTLAAGRLSAPAEVTTLRFDEVDRFVAETSAAGGLVCGTSSWFELERLARSTLRVVPAPGNPARAWSRLGTVLDAVERAPAALARVEELHLQLPVAVDAAVVDVASMAVGVAADRPGLLPEQDRLVSVLTASEIGAVLAPPPGSGKTVIAAAALAELAPDSVLVAAPAAVVDQWTAELARWAPGLRTAVARDVAQVGRLRRRAQVVVASHQVAAKYAASARAPFAVLVVDEAHALLRRSETSAALRAARRLAGRAWALTGSPDESTSSGGIAALVAWVRDLSPSEVRPAPAVEFEPVVAGAGPAVSAELSLPELVIDAVAVPAGPVDRMWFDMVCADPVPPSGLARARMVERRRAGAGDPAAVLAPAAVTGVPAKRTAMLSQVTGHVAAGGAALVFSSSVGVLDRFVAALHDAGVAAAVLPGASDRVARVRALSAFDEGTLSVLAVTPASQRGVNLQRADLVVHLDLPASSAEFVQRNGRAARLGSPHPTVRVVVPFLEGTGDEAWTRAFLAGGDAQAVLASMTAAGPAGARVPGTAGGVPAAGPDGGADD